LRRNSPWIAVCAAVFLCGCASGPRLGPTPASAPTGTSVPAISPVPSPTITSSAIPVLVPGVDTPVLVEGIGVLFTGAELIDSFRSDDPEATPAVTAETYLIVNAEIPEEYLDEALTANVPTWEVTLNDSIPCAYLTSQFGLYNGVRQGKITWVFAVDRQQAPFILHLPGGIDFDLTPLLQ
jgi:hypothetical protein